MPLWYPSSILSALSPSFFELTVLFVYPCSLFISPLLSSHALQVRHIPTWLFFPSSSASLRHTSRRNAAQSFENPVLRLFIRLPDSLIFPPHPQLRREMIFCVSFLSLSLSVFGCSDFYVLSACCADTLLRSISVDSWRRNRGS